MPTPFPFFWKRVKKWVYHRKGIQKGQRWYKRRVWKRIRKVKWHRMTVGINHIEWNHKYYSFTLYHWSDHYPTPNELEDFKEDFMMRLEDELGYEREEFWFSYRLGWEVTEAYKKDVQGDFFETERDEE